MRQFQANPFETSPEQKAANLRAVKAERAALDAEFGDRGSDGVILDTLGELGLSAMDKTELTIDSTIDAAKDFGSLAVSAPSIAADKFRGKK